MKQHREQLAGIARILIVAAALLGSSVVTGQESYDALLQQALQLRNDGDFPAAEQTLRSAREIAAHTSEVDYLLGLMVAYQERYTEALAILETGLSRYPDDVQLQLTKARVLSFNGEFPASLALVHELLDSHPDNTEVTLLAARVNLYVADYAKSRELFRQVLSLQPENLEAMLGLYDTELASGNTARADELLDHTETLYPAAPDVVLRRERSLATVDSSSKSHEINTGYSLSNIDGANLSNWHDRFFEYRYRGQSGNQFFVRSEHLRRFDTHDTLTEVGTILTLGATAPFEFAIAYGDDADFSPEQRFRFATSLKVFEDTNGIGTSMLDLAYSQADYQTGEVSAARLGVTHYFSGINGWANAAALWVRDENNLSSVGWTSGVNWQATSRMRFGYAFTDAPETENNITTDTRNHHLYTSYQLTDSFVLRLDGSRNERENSYGRDTLSLSLQLRF